MESYHLVLKTPLTSRSVLAKIFGVSFLNVGIKKRVNVVDKLKPIITPKLIKERFSVSISLSIDIISLLKLSPLIHK